MSAGQGEGGKSEDGGGVAESATAHIAQACQHARGTLSLHHLRGTWLLFSVIAIITVTLLSRYSFLPPLQAMAVLSCFSFLPPLQRMAVLSSHHCKEFLPCPFSTFSGHSSSLFFSESSPNFLTNNNNSYKALFFNQS